MTSFLLAYSWLLAEQKHGIYAMQKKVFLRTFLDLSYGTHSHDMFNRVFYAIDGEQFEAAFVNWVNTLTKLTKGEVIAIRWKNDKRSSRT